MCCRPCDRGSAVTIAKDVGNPFIIHMDHSHVHDFAAPS